MDARPGARPSDGCGDPGGDGLDQQLQAGQPGLAVRRHRGCPAMGARWASRRSASTRNPSRCGSTSTRRSRRSTRGPDEEQMRWPRQVDDATTNARQVALEYLKAFDNAGVTDSGGSILELFAADAQVYFPKWGVAQGSRRDRPDVRRRRRRPSQSILHDYDTFNYVMTGGDTFAVEGTSVGDAPRRPVASGRSRARRGSLVRRVRGRDGLIQRCFIYLDPDYAGQDIARYPWLVGQGLTMAASNGSMRPFVYDALPGRVLFGPGEFSKRRGRTRAAWR